MLFLAEISYESGSSWKMDLVRKISICHWFCHLSLKYRGD